MSTMLATLKGWKTVIVAGLLGTIDLLQVTDIAPIIPVAWLPVWTAVHPFVFLWLRLVTTGAVGSKTS